MVPEAALRGDTTWTGLVKPLATSVRLRTASAPAGTARASVTRMTPVRRRTRSEVSALGFSSPLPVAGQAGVGLRDRRQVSRRSDLHSGRITAEAGAVGGQIRDVVRGMAWRGPRLEIEDALADDLDRPFRDGNELAPQAVELVAVEPARAPLEPARIDQVRGPDLAHVHAQARVAPDQKTRGAGVVEVDVSEDEVPQILERQ